MRAEQRLKPAFRQCDFQTTQCLCFSLLSETSWNYTSRRVNVLTMRL
jgi:hypothetical protein